MLKVGVQSAGWYDRNDPLGSFTYIKERGFEAVDFNIDHYMNTKKLVEEGIYPTVFDKPVEEVLEEFRPLKEASEQTGVEICQMHAPFPVWFEGEEKVNEHILMALDKCFALCEYLGCPAVVVHPVRGETKEEEMELNLSLYRKMIPLIQKYKGVKICTENIFSRRAGLIIEGRLSHAAEICRLLDQLNAEAGGDYFGCCLDIGHANLTHHNVRQFVLELGKYLTILHVHDNNGAEDQHVIPYTCLANSTEHICDWEGFVAGLKEIGYNGAIAFETFRLFRMFPKAVHKKALELVSAIGHYWVDLIEEK